MVCFQILDDILPSFKRTEQLDKEDKRTELLDKEQSQKSLHQPGDEALEMVGDEVSSPVGQDFLQIPLESLIDLLEFVQKLVTLFSTLQNSRP